MDEETPGRTIISRRDAKRHRVRGENAAGPCAFDVVACTPSSRSTNKRVSPRVSLRQGSTTIIRLIEQVIIVSVTGDPSTPPPCDFCPGSELRKGGGRSASLETHLPANTSRIRGKGRGGSEEKMRQTSGDRVSRMRVAGNGGKDPRVIKRGFERGCDCSSEQLHCL